MTTQRHFHDVLFSFFFKKKIFLFRFDTLKTVKTTQKKSGVSAQARRCHPLPPHPQYPFSPLFFPFYFFVFLTFFFAKPLCIIASTAEWWDGLLHCNPIRVYTSIEPSPLLTRGAFLTSQFVVKVGMGHVNKLKPSPLPIPITPNKTPMVPKASLLFAQPPARKSSGKSSTTPK